MSSMSAPNTRQASGDQAARAALALAALRTAEQRTGARPASLTPQPPPTAKNPPERMIDLAQRPALAVPSQLNELLPGGIQRGAVIQVTGSAALMLEMVAAADCEQLWTAVVGQPLIGILAAAEMGVDLSRLILVPTPGPDAASVLAALLDGVDILVVGPEADLGPSERRRLAARARERGTVIIASSPWSGAHVELNVTGVRWRGISSGTGRLHSRELLVERAGRGSAAQRARVEVILPSGALPDSHPTHTTHPNTPVLPAQTSEPIPELRLVG